MPRMMGRRTKIVEAKPEDELKYAVLEELDKYLQDRENPNLNGFGAYLLRKARAEAIAAERLHREP